MADAPRHDMRCVHSAMTVDGQHTHATKCTAVIVYTHDRPTESLITDIDLVLTFFNCSFFCMLSNLFNQLLAVLISLKVDGTLLKQKRVIFRDKVCLDQSCS